MDRGAAESAGGEVTKSDIRWEQYTEYRDIKSRIYAGEYHGWKHMTYYDWCVGEIERIQAGQPEKDLRVKLAGDGKVAIFRVLPKVGS